MLLPPIVYLGPSLRPEEALSLLPGARLQPPIRRGELFRDRMLRYSVFIILDGAFFQSEAVSPREIVDVLGDGALVVGASSMGALRAAECWPAGMRGVGAIYRLFRAGRLRSDDEVAVAVDPDAQHRALSVPLVNIRHALRKAVRVRLLSPGEARASVDAAIRMHYPDRTWPRILRAAGLTEEEGRRRQFLERLDLKRDDAVRALRHVSALLAREPGLAMRPRRQARPFTLAEVGRERPHDALAGEDPQALKREVCRHQLASGRYTRHLRGLLLSHRLWPELTDEARTGQPCMPQEDAAAGEWLARYAASEEGLGRAAGERRLIDSVWARLGEREAEVAEALWAELIQRGEVDAAVYRWRALRQAEREARARGWTAGSLHHFLAEREIAHAHGFSDWPALEAALRPHEVLRGWVLAYRGTLSLAKRVKEALFQQGLGWGGVSWRLGGL